MSLTESVTTRCSTPLTVQAAEAGIVALQENAARLAHDARLMIHARCFAAAAALAASSLGEIARIPVLLELAHARTDRQLRHFWAKFHGCVVEFPWSLFQADKSQIGDTDLNRMISFIGSAGSRVECLNQEHWTRPRELINPDLATELVRLAELFAANPPEIRTLRLWLDVVGSFPKNTHDAKVLDRFKDRLRAEGLVAHASMVSNFQRRAAGGQAKIPR